jgi:hypothetical protein
LIWALVAVPTGAKAASHVTCGVAAFELDRTAVAILVRRIAGLTVFAISGASAVIATLVALVWAAFVFAPARSPTDLSLAGRASEVTKVGAIGAFVTAVVVGTSNA